MFITDDELPFPSSRYYLWESLKLAIFFITFNPFSNDQTFY